MLTDRWQAGKIMRRLLRERASLLGSQILEPGLSSADSKPAAMESGNERKEEMVSDLEATKIVT